MDRWQTTVRGDTWNEINEAARVAIHTFFEDTPNRVKAMDAMRLDIAPNETYTVRDGEGVSKYHLIEYEATVTVEL